MCYPKPSYLASFLPLDMSPIFSPQATGVFLIFLYCFSELVLKEDLVNSITVSSKELSNRNRLHLPSSIWLVTGGEIWKSKE